MPEKDLLLLQEIGQSVKLKTDLLKRLGDDLEIVSGCKNSQAVVKKINAASEKLRQEIIALKNQRKHIIRKISELPEKQRNILLLRYDAGMSWTQIGAVLGCTARNVQRIKKEIIT